MKKISIVILNWNAAQDTIQCLRQFDSWQAVHVDIWVVDNASVDGSADQIEQACPGVRLIRNPQNEGFSGGTNRGIQSALAQGDAPILLLNNDASVDETALARLYDTLQSKPTIGIVGPLLYRTDDQQLIVAGSKNPVWHLHNQILSIPKDGKPYRVDYISGSVALIRAELLRSVGLLDEDYFFYTEIADLCRRARNKGFDTIVDPAARAYHNLERSSDLRSTLYIYYIIRNRFVYIRKAYGAFGFPLTTFWMIYSALLAFKLQMEGKRATASAVWMGLRDGLRGRSGGQNERILRITQQIKTGVAAL